MGFDAHTSVQRGRPRVILWPDGRLGGRIDLSRYVESITVSKRLEQATGSWSVGVVPWKGHNGPAGIFDLSDLETIVKPNAVVSIGFDVPGGLCLGLVDGMRRQRRYGGSRGMSGLTIEGSDMGKLLEQDSIIHASTTVAEAPEFLRRIEAVVGPDNALAEPITGVFGPENANAKAKVFVGAQINEIVEWALKNAATTRIPLLAAHGGAGRAGDFVVSDVTPWNPGQFVYNDGPKNYNGSLWGFLKSIVDPDFFELIIDSLWPGYPLQPYGPDIPEVRLTIRPKPFDSRSQQWLPTSVKPPNFQTWDNLRTRVQRGPTVDSHWQIPAWQVINEQLGLSDADTFSYFEIQSDTDLFGNQAQRNHGLNFPLVDLSALTRAGLRAYKGRLSLVDPNVTSRDDAAYSGVIPSDIREFRNRLFNWYRLSEFYENGSLTVVGGDHYRVGDKVYLPHHKPFRSNALAAGTYFYVVGTEWSWRLGGNYTTSLRVTRGHNEFSIAAARDEINREAAQLGIPGMLAET